MLVKRTLTLVVPSLLAFVISCSKSNKKDSDTQGSTITATSTGVETTDGATINITGSLNLGVGLTASSKGILAFNLVAGKASDSPTQIVVADDGSFTVPVDRTAGLGETLKEKLAADPINREEASFISGLGQFFSASEDQVREHIASMTDAQLREELSAEIDRMVAAGSVTLLVAYDISSTGDKVAEANSFKFIGLSTASGKVLSAIDSQAIKGNLGLGVIALDSTDDAKSSLSATDALDVSEEAAETLADMSAALKAVKNAYMNDAWSASPFFMWNGGQDLADVIGTFSTPASSSYRGYGFYVGSIDGQDTPFAFDDICSSNPTTVSFTPPSSVEVAQGQDSDGLPSNYVSVSAFANESVSEGTMQEGKRVCQGSSFYARADDTHQFMLNFGTGGGIRGEIPSGLWSLSYNGSELGRFELASAKPVDSDSKSKVFLPSVKFLKNEAGQFIGGEVELYLWNGTEYSKLSDLSPFLKLAGENGLSIWGSGVEESRASAVIADGASKLTVSFDSPVSATGISAGAFYYNIGEQSYRIEFH